MSARPTWNEIELSIVFRDAAIGIAMLDSSERIVRANPFLESFLGFGPGELEGVSVESITHEADYPADREHFALLQRGEANTYQLDKRYRRKDGSIVWGHLIASSVRSSDGTHLYRVGMIQDITEQRRVREELTASREQLVQINQRLRTYLARAPLATVVWGEDQLVREWNPAAEQLLGYTAAEAIGRNVYELAATPEGLAVVDKIRARFAAGEEVTEGVVVENRRKDGTRLQCEWYFTVIGPSDLPMSGILACAIDVSPRIRNEQERRMLESNLRQAQKMQSLGTLAGGIAHDFNNILLAISGNTGLAIDELPESHPAQVSLGEVRKAAARASSIVNQILLFSRREEESLQGPVNLRAIIEESLNLLRATLPARISIVTDLPASPPTVLGDAAQLHQVLLNLATNAAHAMGERGGTLAIRLTPQRIDNNGPPIAGLHPGNYLRLSVQDAGPGMAQAVVQRIFEPFFTTKPRGQGTGLGLSVVHGIVTAHGGAITIDTQLGTGSTFHVYLPALEQGTPAIAPPIAKPVEGQGQHILYVDDEDALVFLIARVLRKLGYRVSTFVDPIEALAAFKADPFAYDALITDLAMPGMAGTDFARQALAVRKDVPVVMTSGYVRPEDRELAIASGVRELVLKPNTVDALGEVLHKLLSARA
jgi:PAS domain S-box-containing protein